jgi:hypothetical protein
LIRNPCLQKRPAGRFFLFDRWVSAPAASEQFVQRVGNRLSMLGQRINLRAELIQPLQRGMFVRE